jgi:hypothetical protein
MAGYYLFLDDMRNPSDVSWVEIPRDRIYDGVRSYEEFVSCVNRIGLPDFVTFDHDLADEHYVAMLAECEGKKNIDYGIEKTGYDCVQWLVAYCVENTLKFPNYTVHSMNPIGKERIDAYMAKASEYLGKD